MKTLHAVLPILLFIPCSARGQEAPQRDLGQAISLTIESLKSEERGLEQELSQRKDAFRKAEAAAAKNDDQRQEKAQAASVLQEALAATQHSLDSLRMRTSLMERWQTAARTLSDSKAPAALLRSRGTIEHELKSGQWSIIPKGTAIAKAVRTGADSQAQLLLSNGSTATLGPLSALNLDAGVLETGLLHFEGAPQALKKHLQKKSESKIRTPNCALSLSDASIDLQYADGASSVTLYDGIAELSRQTTAQLIHPIIKDSPRPLKASSSVESAPGESTFIEFPGGLRAMLEPGTRIETSAKNEILLRKGSARIFGKSEQPPVLLWPAGRVEATEADWEMRVLPSRAVRVILSSGGLRLDASAQKLNENRLDRWWESFGP